MQSISAPGIHIVPLISPVDIPNTIDIPAIDTPSDTKDDASASDYDVLHLEKLLNKIFDDELDKALAAESEIRAGSNLIEFPLMQELIALHEESAHETMDFSPTNYSSDDPVLETDLTRFTPSIIERDDVDFGQMQALIDAQQEQLAALRLELKQRDIVIRSQAIDLACKDDQLKYMPELFDKALRLANVEANNWLMSKDLEVEKLLNEELNGELSRAKGQLTAINSSLLVKFGRVLGVIS